MLTNYDIYLMSILFISKDNVYEVGKYTIICIITFINLQT